MYIYIPHYIPLHLHASSTRRLHVSGVFTHGGVYTGKLLHTEAFTQSSFYTEKSLHEEVLTQRSFDAE